MARKKRIHEEQEKKAKAYKQKIGKPLKKRQGPPAPKKKVSPAKLKRQAAIGSLKGRAASAIGGAGHPVSRAAGKYLKKSQRKKKIAAAVKKVKSAVSSVSRAGGKRAKQVRKIKKMQKAGMKVTRVKSVPLKKTSPHGKIRKGAKKVLATKGGAYASYEKGSKAAGSFRKAFKSGCAGGAKSFSWDGRSYSCKKK